MQKNLKKILIINLAIILIIITVAEVVSLRSYRRKYSHFVINQANLCENPEECIKQNMPHYSLPRKIRYEDYKESISDKTYKSKVPQKRPILTIGCSYTYGSGLEDNQTFAYKLNKYTGRTTYNRGILGAGPQLVYRQLTDKNFKNDVPDAEYVIYTFIHHHLYRQLLILTCPFNSDICMQYKIKGDNLVEYYSTLGSLSFSFLMKTYLEYKNQQDYNKEVKNGLPLFTKIMEKSVQQTKKMYPNSKFVFVEFPDASFCWGDENINEQKLTSDQVEQLKSFGIIYVNSMDLVGHNFCERKYRLADGDHPSEQAWDELVPKLVQKLNL